MATQAAALHWVPDARSVDFTAHTSHPALPQPAAPTHPLTHTEEVRKERAKETKHDTTIELAALLHEVRQQQQELTLLRVTKETAGSRAMM